MKLNWCRRVEASSSLLNHSCSAPPTVQREEQKKHHVSKDAMEKWREPNWLKLYYIYSLTNTTNLHFPQPSMADKWPWIRFAG